MAKRKHAGEAVLIADYKLDLTGLDTPWLTVTSLSDEAVAWFHVGFNWYWAFQMEEALRCFQTALEHDPSFGMAHWGAALVHGPNYNNFGAVPDHACTHCTALIISSHARIHALCLHMRPLTALQTGLLQLPHNGKITPSLSKLV